MVILSAVVEAVSSGGDEIEYFFPRIFWPKKEEIWKTVDALTE